MDTRLRFFVASCALIAVSTSRLPAQDTRTVSEPKVREACITLQAELTPVGDTTIAEGDEAHPDTRRIQSAIDHGAKGSAVLLRAEGPRRAFLSGPLDLRDGVTLVVDSGTVLLASRNPRDYDLTPHSCGIVSEKGHGCKALINGDAVTGAGVMGPGTIDGRGWAPLLGSGVSWREIAEPRHPIQRRAHSRRWKDHT